MWGKRLGLVVLFLVTALSGAAVLLDSAPAQARPRAGNVQQQAREAFVKGKDAFDKGQYADALEQFRIADELHPGFAPKFKIAECLDKLGRAEEAVRAYRAFIDAKPTHKYADKVAEAGARIAQLEASLPATVSINVAPPDAPGLRFTVDGAPQPGPELKVQPGQHTIGIIAEGYEPVTKSIVAWAGERLAITVTLAPAIALPPTYPPPPPPPKDEPADVQTIAGWSAVGLAGVGVIIGTVFGVKAIGAQSDFEQTPTVELADDQESSALVADVSFGVSIALGVTGAVLLLTGDGKEPPRAQPRHGATPELTPYAGPHGGGMAATWTF